MRKGCVSVSAEASCPDSMGKSMSCSLVYSWGGRLVSVDLGTWHTEIVDFDQGSPCYTGCETAVAKGNYRGNGFPGLHAVGEDWAGGRVGGSRIS